MRPVTRTITCIRVLHFKFNIKKVSCPHSFNLLQLPLLLARKADKGQRTKAKGLLPPFALSVGTFYDKLTITSGVRLLCARPDCASETRYFKTICPYSRVPQCAYGLGCSLAPARRVRVCAVHEQAHKPVRARPPLAILLCACPMQMQNGPPVSKKQAT